LVVVNQSELPDTHLLMELGHTFQLPTMRVALFASLVVVVVLPPHLTVVVVVQLLRCFYAYHLLE
jgi:hypothetical protein